MQSVKPSKQKQKQQQKQQQKQRSNQKHNDDDDEEAAVAVNDDYEFADCSESLSLLDRSAEQQLCDSSLYSSRHSRSLSRLLRHSAPSRLLREDGFCRVSAAAAAAHVTEQQLLAAVLCNDKKRFSLAAGDKTGALYVRADQGHSLPVAVALDTIDPLDQRTPLLLVHGTKHEAWPLIKQSGALSRMSRLHVHMSADKPRGGSNVLIWISVPRLHAAALKLYKSRNNVYLCPGDDKGCVPLSCVEYVVDTQGTALWRNPDKLEERNANNNNNNK